MNKRYKKSFKVRPKRKGVILKLIFNLLKNKYFWLFVLIICLISILLYFLFLSSFLRIKEIDVFGNQKIDSKDIIEIVERKIQENIIPLNILLVNLQHINEIIVETYPLIDNVKINRKFPNKLTIEIQERQAVAAWCESYFVFIKEENEEYTDDKEEEYWKCFDIDINGVAFEKNGNSNLLIKSRQDPIREGDKVIEKEKLESILTIKTELEKNQINVKDFLISKSENKTAVRTDSLWEIYFNLDDNIGDQLFNLKLILEEKITNRENLEYIDLRFGNKLYYRKIQGEENEQ